MGKSTNRAKQLARAREIAARSKSEERQKSPAKMEYFEKRTEKDVSLPRSTERKAKEAAVKAVAEHARLDHVGRSPSAFVKEVVQAQNQGKAPSRKRSYSQLDANPPPPPRKTHEVVDVTDYDKLVNEFHSRQQTFNKTFRELKGQWQRYGRRAQPGRSISTATIDRQMRRTSAAFDELSEVGHQICGALQEVRASLEEHKAAMLEASLNALTQLKLNARLTDLQLGDVIKTLHDGFNIPKSNRESRTDRRGHSGVFQVVHGIQE
jgi:hypothetical protein